MTTIDESFPDPLHSEPFALSTGELVMIYRYCGVDGIKPAREYSPWRYIHDYTTQLKKEGRTEDAEKVIAEYAGLTVRRIGDFPK